MKVYKKSGKLPPPRNLVAEAASQRRLGGGKHHSRTLDVARGRRRSPKHKGEHHDNEARP